MITRLLIVLMLFVPTSSFAETDNTVTIHTKSGLKKYNVEIADGVFSRMKGLMFRSSLPDDEGMLFLFDDENIRQFWMKNVPFSIDIVFIDRCGKIVTIHENAVPNSEEVISSIMPAKAALEISSGQARSSGFEIGDQITVQFENAGIDDCG